MLGVYFTGGSLNPARSLGPAVVTRDFPTYFWIYFIGPIFGALLASGFYALLKYLRWKECNPGQDWNDVEQLEAEGRLGEQEEPANGAGNTNKGKNASVHEVQPQGGSSGNGLLAD